MVRFEKERMAQLAKRYDLWWEGKAEEPLLKLVIGGVRPRKETSARRPGQHNCMQLSAEEMVEAVDADLSACDFLDAGYPSVNLDFYGPGCLAAMSGGRYDNSSGRMWFFPQREGIEIGDVHAVYDPESPMAKHIKAYIKAGQEYWNGSVIMGMPDLGGVLDVAASLVGSENLLYDLIDEPEEVHRLSDEIEVAWYEAYNDFAKLLAPQGGFTHWSGILSSGPSYITQCDFCYMIGNPMFREFVLPVLKRDTEKLDHVIYHLDGVGELNHFEDILSIPKLDAVQWVWGDGKPSAPAWIEIYQKIRDAGKRMMVNGSVDDYLSVVTQVKGCLPYWGGWFNAGDDSYKRLYLR